MTPDYTEREKRFRDLQDNLPNTGKIVECLDGIPASVRVEDSRGERQLLTYVIIDDQATGWFLKFAAYGVVVFIDRKDHEKILTESVPDDEGRPTVERLRIIRQSVRGTSLIGELVDE